MTLWYILSVPRDLDWRNLCLSLLAAFPQTRHVHTVIVAYLSRGLYGMYFYQMNNDIIIISLLSTELSRVTRFTASDQRERRLGVRSWPCVCQFCIRNKNSSRYFGQTELTGVVALFRTADERERRLDVQGWPRVCPIGIRNSTPDRSAEGSPPYEIIGNVRRKI